ncbi:XRE family transcriptional regulator (fragment) [Candidatus Desulfosporosinus infrequens]|uniref:XRE family transcriptional regulator n=1 Tax=Candidatus Desulfosporosinus infrequens TaxID=2043169 RepID=A0A2U3LGX1_9FIRM
MIIGMGSRIRVLRLERGLTQDQMAYKLDMNRANFSHYERDTSSPPCEVLVKIADILNTTTDFLLGRTDTNPPDAATIKQLQGINELPQDKRRFVINIINSIISEIIEEAKEE